MINSISFGANKPYSPKNPNLTLLPKSSNPPERFESPCYFEDYDLDSVEFSKKPKTVKSLEITDKKQKRELLKEAWHIYYSSVDELNEKDPKAYYDKTYSSKKGNHFEIAKYGGKKLFGSWKTKEVFVFKENAPVTYTKYKLNYSYSGYDGEGWMFTLNEKPVATCNFL